MADRLVVSPELRRWWAELLPGHEALGDDLLNRWSEPHRRYHDSSHLTAALRALAELGGTARTERLALWFHDAIYTGRPGTDEADSAELARFSLSACGLGFDEVAEVSRLVLITAHHSPPPSDAAGARVSDADLAILGADPHRYAASVAALRAESPPDSWRADRLSRLDQLLAAESLFHTAAGRLCWAAQARLNLTTERELLLATT